MGETPGPQPWREKEGLPRNVGVLDLFDTPSDRGYVGGPTGANCSRPFKATQILGGLFGQGVSHAPYALWKKREREGERERERESEKRVRVYAYA